MWKKNQNQKVNSKLLFDVSNGIRKTEQIISIAKRSISILDLIFVNYEY